MINWVQIKFGQAQGQDYESKKIYAHYLYMIGSQAVTSSGIFNPRVCIATFSRPILLCAYIYLEVYMYIVNLANYFYNRHYIIARYIIYMYRYYLMTLTPLRNSYSRG